jgi:hypothetical protein
MGARRPGLVRVGFRRLAQAPEGGITTVVGDPLGTRKSGEWYAWGFDYAPAATAEDPAGAGIAANPGIPAGGGGVAGYMMALPGWFPEPGTITAIASLLAGDQAGNRGWVGIARDSILGTDHFPAATTEVSSLVTGAGAGVRKIRGGAVSLATEGNEILWWIFQDFGGFGAGAVWTGITREAYTIALGNTAASGLALGATVPGAAFTLDSGIGYQSAAAQVLTLGRAFPRTAGSYGLLSSANNGTMWGSVAMPVPLYQWTRAV